MKQLAFIFLLFTGFYPVFSQSEKILIGTVVSDSIPVNKVDVINDNNKASTTTDANGKFRIQAMPNDKIFFYSFGYGSQQRIISEADLNNEAFSVELVAKAIELGEVVVEGKRSFKIPIDQAKISELNLEKQNNAIRNPAIYDGAIVNGVDFVRIGKDVGKVFKKIFGGDEEVKSKLVNIDFKRYVRQNIDQDFYLNTLRLNKNEIELFLEFCDADPDSKIHENSNILKVMDFMISKSAEFKRMGVEDE